MMKAVITNNEGDYFYTVENIEIVIYRANSVTLGTRLKDEIEYRTCRGNDVIINIFTEKD